MGYRAVLVLPFVLLLPNCTPGVTVPPPGPAPLPAPEGTPVPPAPAPAPTPADPSSGLPPIPSINGPLAISVVHPPPGTQRPNADSVFVFGSLGTGSAQLTINSIPVAVAPNGAFLAFLPRPRDDLLRFQASAGNQVAEEVRSYVAPTPGAVTPTPPRTIPYATPRVGRVVGLGDTLGTGSDVAVGRPTPTGTYRWFLPTGARVVLTGERDDMLRVRLDSATEAWFPDGAIVLEDVPPLPATRALPTVVPGESWTDVVLPVGGAPFHIEATDSLLELSVHGVSGGYRRVETGDAIAPLVEYAPNRPDAATVRIYPARRAWGFKAFYQPDGSLTVRVRRAPDIDPENPLRGIRVVVDPGHPPAGAVGPTGLLEADANLGIGLRLAEQLRVKGADVLITRTTYDDLALQARVDTAVAWNADLLVSVHNNAYPEGVNPFRRHGTSTYYFHPFAEDLAESLNAEILGTALTRDLGVLEGNLALVRPTWFPSVLTESLFMPVPEHEAALRNSLFLERLAAAHVRGIERFLRDRR
jgi:N-acetylmuramoyl-L-alanine amidase